MLTTPHHKTGIVNNHRHVRRAWKDNLVRPKQRKTEVRFGIRNFGSLYRAGSLTAAAMELARY